MNLHEIVNLLVFVLSCWVLPVCKFAQEFKVIDITPLQTKNFLINKQPRMCNKLRLRLRLLHIGLGLRAAIFGPSAHPVLYLRSVPLNPTSPNHLKISQYIEIEVRRYEQTNNWSLTGDVHMNKQTIDD